MTETPRSYLELLVPNRSVNAADKPESTHPVWRELRRYPPQLIAILSDSVQYVVDDESQIVGFEISNGGWDRIETAIDINQEFPTSKLLTLSTSLDNIVECWPDSHLYQLSMILTGRMPLDNFLLPQSRSYDTFTELIEIVDTARSTLWGNFDNIAIVTSGKQARRASVMLDTLISADDPTERERFDRYFEVYMPQRLANTPEDRMHEAFARYKTIAYRDILPNDALLRRKKFMIVSSEDITGKDLGEDEELEANLRGAQDWLDGIYGHKYMLSDKTHDDRVEIVIRHSSDPTEIPRIHIPHIGSPEAKEAGISWGLTKD